MYCILLFLLFISIDAQYLQTNMPIEETSDYNDHETTTFSIASTSNDDDQGRISNTHLLDRLSQTMSYDTVDTTDAYDSNNNNDDTTTRPYPFEVGSADVKHERCNPTENDLDIIFVVDSSTNNYKEKLNLISNIIKNELPINSKIILINFSQCNNNNNNKSKCKQQDILNDYGLTNYDVNVISNAINSLQTGYNFIRYTL